MVLHSDIFWVGRQWAVTGSGLQMVDQRLKGVFDIGIDRLWDEELAQRIRAMRGINAADFEMALAAARSRYPEPVPTTAPSVQPQPVVSQPTVPVPPAFVVHAEGRLARFLPQWRVRR